MDELYQLFPFFGYKVSSILIKEDPISPVRVFLERLDQKPFQCHVCGCPMSSIRGKLRRSIEDLRLAERRTFVRFTRLKGKCTQCRKVRLECVDFVSMESPSFSKRYAFLLGKLCEIAQPSRVAEHMGHSKMTLWRVDLERMERFFKSYALPEGITHLAVDEAYSRSTREDGETRNDQFFTIVTDLKLGKVIAVTHSRRKEALDAFFSQLGPEKCANIEVVATDQHEDYASSIKHFCPNAIQVLDKFHLIKRFEEAINDTRKRLYKMLPQKEVKELARPKFRFVFLKAASKRTEDEAKHIEQVCKDNEAFIHLELIKERMLTLFQQSDEGSARAVFLEIRKWIWEAGFPELKDWWRRLNSNWQTVENYFLYPASTAISEGMNNVIKAVKRCAFGYRNMRYFQLKILQRCGLLNSKFMTDSGSWTPKGQSLFGSR